MTSHKNVNNDIKLSIKFNHENLTSFEHYQNFLDQKRLIFTTGDHVKSYQLLTHKKFDYVIVYGANFIEEPAMIEYLFFGKKFLLFGFFWGLCQWKQMPQMETSLFEKLCLEFSARNVSYLDINYEIACPEIIKLNNELVYQKTLSLKFFSGEKNGQGLTADKGNSGCNGELSGINSEIKKNEFYWIRDLILTKNPVTFLDMDKFEEWRLENPEVQKYLQARQELRRDEECSMGYNSQSKICGTKNFLTGKSCHSGWLDQEDDIYLTKKPQEDFAIFLIAKLIEFGKKAEQIAQITTYTKERAYLQSKLGNNSVEVTTTVQNHKTSLNEDSGSNHSQTGVPCYSYKDIIVVLQGIYDDEQFEKELVEMKISLTRARKKIFIIGRKFLLEKFKGWKVLGKFVEDNDWEFDFEDGGMRKLCSSGFIFNAFSGSDIKKKLF